MHEASVPQHPNEGKGTPNSCAADDSSPLISLSEVLLGIPEE
jgi:hypothetical protein